MNHIFAEKLLPADKVRTFGLAPPDKPRVGDIVYASWGYSMTIIDFAKVVEISKTGKTVVVVMIGAKLVQGDTWSPGGGQVAPDPDNVLYDGKRFRMHVRKSTFKGTWALRGSYAHCNMSKRLGTFWKSAGTHYECHWD